MNINNHAGKLVYNNYNRTSTELQKTLEKLSSGSKINRAGDDAAGLTIGEKMKAQIRGLSQASHNIEDGLSLIKTAERGLAQIQNPNILRMRELIIQASNDTLTLNDRQIIQSELDQITKSIDDIADSSDFNTLPLLTPDRIEGNNSGKKPIDIVFFIDDSGTMAEEIETVRLAIGTFAANLKEYGDAKIATLSVVHNRSIGLTDDIEYLKENLGKVHQATGGSTSTYQKIQNTINGNEPSITFRADSQKVFVILTDTIDESSPTNISQDDLKSALTNQSIQSYVFGLNFASYNSSNNFSASNAYNFVDKIYTPINVSEISENITPDLANVIIKESGLQESQQTNIIIQAGPNEGQQLMIPLYNNRSSALGLGNIVIGSYEATMESLKRVDIASSIISERRSKYGAIQNRLEHAFNNINSLEENLTNALSRVTDTDIAKATMELTQKQVLLQSSQTMLAQVNQMSQGILQLLK